MTNRQLETGVGALVSRREISPYVLGPDGLPARRVGAWVEREGNLRRPVLGDVRHGDEKQVVSTYVCRALLGSRNVLHRIAEQVTLLGSALRGHERGLHRLRVRRHRRARDDSIAERATACGSPSLRGYSSETATTWQMRFWPRSPPTASRWHLSIRRTGKRATRRSRPSLDIRAWICSSRSM